MKIYAIPMRTMRSDIENIEMNYEKSTLAGQIIARDAAISEMEDSLEFRSRERESAGERITELEDERDAAIARLPDGMKHCTIVCEKCEIGHSWLTATNWVEHGCPTCEKNALITRILNLEKAARQIKCVDISQADAVRERDKALASVGQLQRAFDALEELLRRRTIELDALNEAGSTLAVDAAHARADRYGRALKAAVELIP